MGKAKTFFEVFVSALNEDFRFPILEIFFSIHIVGVFIILYYMTAGGPGGQAGRLYQTLQLGGIEEVKGAIVSGFAGLWTFAFQTPVFGMLILKNIAYSFGNDLERGTVQNLLSYPLKRRLLLTAKLLSSIGVVYLLSVGISILELYVLIPSVVSQNLAFVFFTFVASLSFPFLVSILVLLITLLSKRGSTALFLGIGLYVASFFIILLLVAVASTSGNTIFLKLAAIIFPGLGLQAYYNVGLDPSIAILAPSFNEALLYIGAGYVLAFLLLALVYLYFERRLQI